MNSIPIHATSVRALTHFFLFVNASSGASAALTGRSLRHSGRPDRCSRRVLGGGRGVETLVEDDSTVSGQFLPVGSAVKARCPRLYAESGCRRKLHARVAQPLTGRRASKAPTAQQHLLITTSRVIIKPSTQLIAVDTPCLPNI